MTRDFASPQDLASVLTASLQQAISLSGAELGNIQLMNWKTGTLRIAAQMGFGEKFLAFFRHVAASDSCACGRALHTRHAVVVDDIASNEDFRASRAILLEAGVRAVQSTPLISSSGAFLGVASTHFSTPHAPTSQELENLELWAREAANGIIFFIANGNGHGRDRPEVWERLAASQKAIASSYELLRRVSRVRPY